MIPFIPNDKFDILNLGKCWMYAKTNICDIENQYFGELASKTYELFLAYNKEESIPKELVLLISSLSEFANAGEYEEYSTPDVMKEIATSLLYGLSNGFKLTVDLKDRKMKFDSTLFGVSYNGKWYQLDASTFDISPILNKQSIKI